MNTGDVAARWYEDIRPISCAIATASVVCLAVHWGLDQYASAPVARSLISYLLKDAGIAGLVALFLNLTIEWVNRKKHADHQQSLLTALETKHEESSKKLLEDVNKQLFRTVYKRNIDPAVFNQVEKHLLLADVMRRDFRASFKLKKFMDPDSGGPTEFAELDVIYDFRVFNLTDKPVTCPVAKALVDVTPKYREFCRFKRITVGGEVFENDLLAKYVDDVPDRNFIVLLLPKAIPPNDSIPVRIEYKKLAPLDYSELVVTTLPMDGLTIEVSDPHEMFTVEAISLHPEDERRDTPLDQKHLARWSMDQAFLPGQGMVMMWHPTEVAAPPARE
ncbi:MAG: hypothetical protein V4757_06260 [Pseudomonadota bacterium]